LAHSPGDLAVTSGLLAGLAHPWLGLDHLLAMVAVGMLGWRQGGRAAWALPVLFMAVMCGGALAGIAAAPLPIIETGIALSVVALGVLLISGDRLPLTLLSMVVAGMALLHGHAHGTEMPLLANPLAYVSGFLLGTAGLHATGMLLAALYQRQTPSVIGWRLSGVAMLAAGIVLWTR